MAIPLRGVPLIALASAPVHRIWSGKKDEQNTQQHRQLADNGGAPFLLLGLQPVPTNKASVTTHAPYLSLSRPLTTVPASSNPKYNDGRLQQPLRQSKRVKVCLKTSCPLSAKRPRHRRCARNDNKASEIPVYGPRSHQSLSPSGWNWRDACVHS